MATRAGAVWRRPRSSGGGRRQPVQTAELRVHYSLARAAVGDGAGERSSRAETATGETASTQRPLACVSLRVGSGRIDALLFLPALLECTPRATRAGQRRIAEAPASSAERDLEAAIAALTTQERRACTSVCRHSFASSASSRPTAPDTCYRTWRSAASSMFRHDVVMGALRIATCSCTGGPSYAGSTSRWRPPAVAAAE